MRTPGGIHIPGTVTSLDPPKFVCLVCRTPFAEREFAAYQRHVAKCVKENEADLRAASLREKAPGIFGDEAGDPEYRAHLRRRGGLK